MWQGGGDGPEVQVRMKVDIYTDGENDGLQFYQSVNTGYAQGVAIGGFPLQNRPPSLLPGQESAQPMIQWPESATNSEADRASVDQRKKKHRKGSEKENGSLTSLSSAASKQSAGHSGKERRRRRSKDELKRPEEFKRIETPTHPWTSSEDTLHNTSKDDSFGDHEAFATRPKTFPREFRRPEPIISPPATEDEEEPLNMTPQDVTINTFEDSSSSEPGKTVATIPSRDILSLLKPMNHENHQDYSIQPPGRRFIRQVDEQITTTTFKFAAVSLPQASEASSYATREEPSSYAFASREDPFGQSRPNYYPPPSSQRWSSDWRTKKPEAPPRQYRVSFGSVPETTVQEYEKEEDETLIDDPGTYSASIPQLSFEPRALRPNSRSSSTNSDDHNTRFPYRPPSADLSMESEHKSQPARYSSRETLIDDVEKRLPPPPKEVSHVRKETLIDDVIVIDCEEETTYSHFESRERTREAEELASVSSTGAKGIPLAGGSDDEDVTTLSGSSSSTETGGCDHDFKPVPPSPRQQPKEDETHFGWLQPSEQFASFDEGKSPRPLSSEKIFQLYTKPREAEKPREKGRVPLAEQEESQIEDGSSASGGSWRRNAGPGASQRGKIGGIYANPDLYDENLTDYLQGRLSPVGKEMGESCDGSTLSKDSVVSEASYRADRSHQFFNQAPPERSFAEIMSKGSGGQKSKKKEWTGTGGSNTSLSSYGSLRQDSVRHAPVLKRPPMGERGLYGEAKIGMAQLGKDQIPFTDRRKPNTAAPTAL